jgi:hypothetical protein
MYAVFGRNANFYVLSIFFLNRMSLDIIKAQGVCALWAFNQLTVVLLQEGFSIGSSEYAL